MFAQTRERRKVKQSGESYNDNLIKRKNSPKAVLAYSDKKAISLCRGPTVKPLHQTLSFSASMAARGSRRISLNRSTSSALIF